MAWKVLAIASVAIASVAVAAPVSRPGSSDHLQLLRIEQRWNDAVVARNAPELDRILADDFLLIWVNGAISTKAELIAAAVGRKAEIEPFRTEDVLVRVYGNVAVLTGRFRQTARLGARSEINSFRYTDVYRRSKRGWQAVSAHASLLPPPK
ncbi:MAG: nuclear transport factor 2 family protein [Sphingosinicella sp.]|nr:nuclear transport factor 2 family protein [Sphingosinicella sp.]